MPDDPKNIGRFWRELKRRKVVRVTAMYAATAFIIMEAADIMLPRLGLPDWTVTFIIALLIAGLPITIILSWIFDITPDGLKKTEPVQEANQNKGEEGGSGKRSIVRRLKASDGIIAILFVAVCILVYPKIFGGDKFKKIRDEDGKISILVMPFQNLTADSTYTDVGLGLQNMLISKLSNSRELSVRQTQTVSEILSDRKNLNYSTITPGFAQDIARKLHASTVIQGGINKFGSVFRITANLMDADTREIYQSFEIDCDSESEVLAVTDSLSSLLKNFLEIKVLEKNQNKEIRSFAGTGSAEAYIYFSKGLNKFWDGDFDAASSMFENALMIDPDFFSAAMWLIPTYSNMGMGQRGRQIAEELSTRLDHCSYAEQVTIRYWQSFYRRDPYESIKYARLIVEENPMQRSWWYQLGNDYSRTKQYREAINAYEKALEIDKNWGGGWKWAWGYGAPGMIYHELGNHKRENEIYESGLEVLPDHPLIMVRQAVCRLSQGDSLAAKSCILKIRSVMEGNDESETKIEYYIGWIYEMAEMPAEAEIHYRLAVHSGLKNDIYYLWSLVDLASLLITDNRAPDEGIRLLRQAEALDPSNTELMTKLYRSKGLWFLHNGNKMEALSNLKQALEFTGEYEYDHVLQIRELEKTLNRQDPG